MRTIPWLVLLGWALAHSALAGCAGTLGASTYVSDVPGLSAQRLLAKGDEPVLFLGAERDAPAVGYASSDVVVVIVGKAKAGRVPVKVMGALEVRAHVPADRLVLRVQRRGRLRDTPVYFAPNDRVRVLGPAKESGRARVVAAPMLVGYDAVPYEGSYPVIGLAAKDAPTSALAPEPGAPFELAPGLPFSLYDAPNGKVIFAPKASPLALDLTVLRQEGRWFAVRVGSGPYLIGYTNAQITPRKAQVSAPSKAAAPAAAASAIPLRLLHERGALRRVVAGTKLLFNNQPIATLHADAWARVLAEYPNGEIDAFVAVDDGIAIRALLPRSALRDAVAQ